MANDAPLIYLDHHATTPCDPRVVEAMLPYFSEYFGNPSSDTHAHGRRAKKAVQTARTYLADLIGAQRGELIFTSGATEANNLAVLGLAGAYDGPRRKLVIGSIEHKAVTEPCARLAKAGFDLVMLPVDSEGFVSLPAAEAAIDDQTLLVSVQTANNEVGTIQPISCLADLAHSHGALFHTDAAQAVGKIPVDVEALEVDLLSLSGHKFYGPKGAGALYLRGGPAALPLEAVLLGGGHERGLRSGTLNVPAIVGLGEAARLAKSEMERNDQHVRILRDRLLTLLREGIPELSTNGPHDVRLRLGGNLSVTFPQVDAEALIIACRRSCLSTGSACTSGAIEPSRVLQAMGLSREEAYRTIRIGLGRGNSFEEVEEAGWVLVGEYGRLVATGGLSRP